MTTRFMRWSDDVAEIISLQTDRRIREVEILKLRPLPSWLNKSNFRHFPLAIRCNTLVREQHNS